MTEPTRCEVVVVGGGIVGVAAAAFLAKELSVVLVEKEATLAQHTTGRSAAQYLENYGRPISRVLTLGSRSFFTHPLDDVSEAPLVSPRPMLTIGRHSDIDALALSAAEGRSLVASIREVSASEARALCPVLRADYVGGGVYEPDAMDIDVMAVHQVLVHLARRDGAAIRTSSGVETLDRAGSRWVLGTPSGVIEADTVVSAAGAWADAVAEMAGQPTIGLRPLRRTAFTTAAPVGSETWPLVYAADHSFYFKPEGGNQLLCSPADETLSAPFDARPEEIDVALAIERINEATTLGIRHVRSAWAGLRGFVADREPVVGADPDEPSFVWAAGVGGTGIQTAPAVGRLISSLILDRSDPADLASLGLTGDQTSPRRHATTGDGLKTTSSQR